LSSGGIVKTLRRETGGTEKAEEVGYYANTQILPF